MKKSIALSLVVGTIASIGVSTSVSFGEAADTSCWDEYNTSGRRMYRTVAPKDVDPQDCTPGVGCFFGYRATDGKKVRLYVPHDADAKTACTNTPAPTTPTEPTTAPTVKPTETSQPPVDTMPATTEPTTAPTIKPTTTTTTTTTTVAPNPSVPPTPPAGVQFVETFDNNAGGDRFDYWVYHRNMDRYGESYGYSYGDWQGDHDMGCNGPDTMRPGSFKPGDGQAQRVNQSVYVCKNHMMTSMGDVEAYSIVTFSPKQVFPSVSSVCFDVNLTDLGNAQWWKVGVVSDAKYNSMRRDGGMYDVPAFLASDQEASGVEANLATNDMLIASWSGGLSGGWPGGLKIGNTTSNVMMNPAPNDVATRFPVCLKDNKNNTVTFSVNGKSFTKSGSFPAGPARVVFYDHSYEPDQTCIYANTNCSGGHVVHTSWHWDNITVT